MSRKQRRLHARHFLGNVGVGTGLTEIEASTFLEHDAAVATAFLVETPGRLATCGRRRENRGAVLSKFPYSIVVIFLIAGAAQNAAAFGQAIDPHRLYEQRCSGCHAEHAGDFVHENLVRSDGDIIGRQSGRELRAFLEAGHGALSLGEIVSLVTHLTSIQRSGRLFHDKCFICHNRAVDFARHTVLMEDGELIGRYSGRNIEQFLLTHGRLKNDEVPRMVEVLKRQLKTLEQ